MAMAWEEVTDYYGKLYERRIGIGQVPELKSAKGILFPHTPT